MHGEYCQQVPFSPTSIGKYDRARLSHRKAHSFVSSSRDELWPSNIAKTLIKSLSAKAYLWRHITQKACKIMINDESL